MSESKYEVTENKIIINGKLELTLWVDSEEHEGVEPTEHEWLDEGAFGLYNREKGVGVQVQARKIEDD